ncbi:caskin-1-like [Strigops habroptila]|uniref:caskin-1-like n=1 Tax=Strigops habroptila TaxID=2489341 RepID=UPI0011CFF1DC|nr:caskin-1-like [Strigops habroptila]
MKSQLYLTVSENPSPAPIIIPLRASGPPHQNFSAAAAAPRWWPPPSAPRRSRPALLPAGLRRSGATPAPPAALMRQRHRRLPFSATSSSGAQPAALASPTHFLASMVKGSHEEQARGSRTLGSRRRHRTHISIDSYYRLYIIDFFMQLLTNDDKIIYEPSLHK